MPNTREKLIELLSDSVYENVELDDGYVGYDVNNEQIADYLISHGVTVQQWISVKDRLPEFNQPCLCYKKVHGHPEYRLGKYLGATFSDNCAAFRSMSHFGCIGATHWMPLPQPPKGE